jgi:antitoxin component YwqK of YwqJK toxin-antitoxin module
MTTTQSAQNIECDLIPTSNDCTKSMNDDCTKPMRDDRLENLLRICKKYANNESYFYKVCSDYLSKDTRIKWLVVMKKTKNSKTNISTNINTNINAKTNYDTSSFIANNVKIVNIININKPRFTKSHIMSKTDVCECCNTNIETKGTKYEIGKFLSMSEHDNDNSINHFDEICYGGFKCFGSLRIAYYTSDMPKKFTGFWIHNICAPGINRTEGNYIRGLKTGPWKEINIIGQIESSGEYKNDKKIGYWIMRHQNGWTDGFFEDDKKNGLWTYRFGDDQKLKLSEGEFIDDEKSGHWTFWNDDGKKLSEGKYCEGKKYGRWIYWHSNGQKESEGEYILGKKTGFWQNWFWNGSKSSEGFFTNGMDTGTWKRYNFS